MPRSSGGSPPGHWQGPPPNGQPPDDQLLRGATPRRSQLASRPNFPTREDAVSQTAQVPADLDRQNGTTLGRILGRGNVGRAEEGPDGKMRATVRIPEDELVFDPGVLILPHAGV